MAHSAIQLQKLGKKYLIGASKQRGYRTLRETLTDLLAAPSQMLRSGGALGRTEEFWALRDLSFDITEGEVVGIIGRNGAGKSTLLKILSGITPPSEGRAVMNGRVGSLLEVGTGFHQELSGRENIYLNGSILGMNRREITQKFDEIVDYSGVEKFLDTPVKRYSSGMRVRLAFAVAAFLEPEVLIVDEVLAVGDMEFQKKCLGTMTKVAESGRTVLFVSHNMAAVSALCTRAITISNGQVIYDGSTSEAISHYNSTASRHMTNNQYPIPRENCILNLFQINTPKTGNTNTIKMNEPFTLEIDIDVTKQTPELHILAVLNRESDNLRVASITTRESPHGQLTPGNHHIDCNIDQSALLPGHYNWTLHLVSRDGIHESFEKLSPFSIEEIILPGASHPYRQAHGVCHICSRIQSRTNPSRRLSYKKAS